MRSGRHPLTSLTGAVGPLSRRVVAALAAGLLGRLLLHFAFPLADGLVLRLDSAVALLVTLVAGPLLGLVTSLTATLYNTPYSSTWPWLGEVLAVAALVRAGWLPVLAATSYWLVLGGAFATGLLSTHLPLADPMAGWAKQLINAALSAIMADGLAQVPAVRRMLGAEAEAQPVTGPTLQAQVARLIVPVAMAPGLILGLAAGRLYADRLEASATTQLLARARAVAAHLDHATALRRLDADEVGALLSQVTDEPGMTSVLLDDRGRVLASAGDRAEPDGRDLHDHAWIRATAATEMAVVLDAGGADAVPRQYTAVRANVPSLGGQVHLKRDRRVIEAPLAIFYALTALLMTAGTLAALPLARWLSRRLTQPLDQLAAAAVAVGRGQRGAIGNLPLQAPLEVEHLQAQLEAMVERLDDAVQHLDRRVQERTAELTIAKARTDTILRTASDGMFVIDGHGDLADVNDAFCRLLGYGRDELVGRPLASVAAAPPDSLTARFAQIVAHGEQRFDMTLRPRTGDPIELDVAATAVPFAGQQIFASARDLRERLRGEQDRARLEAQLRQSQKMEAIGTLAGGIAHDFNNVLTLIAGNVDRALHEVGTDHPAAATLSHIRRATARADALVRQILAFSRRRDEQRAVVALPAIVEDAVALLRSTLPAMIEIRLQVAPDVPCIDADPVQIHQVVMNLASNAGYAMRDTGGVLAIEVEGTPLGARIVVSDTGSGMDEATCERIFEPFFTTKPQGQGSGLGLAVVHGIVTAHGGAIDVRSAPGRGTRLTIHLPAAGRPARPVLPVLPVAGVEAGAPHGHGHHLFFVDDEPEIVELVSLQLEHAGFVVTGFGRAADALAALDAGDHPCDLLVTDVAMPKMSGLDLAERVRRRDLALPIVLCSGFLTDDDVARAKRLDVTGVLPKPYSPKELARLAERLLTARDGVGGPPHSPGPSWPGESAAQSSPSWRS